MKYLDEYRDGTVARKIVDEIHRVQTRPWVIMEVCGGQTHSIVKNGIDHLLPEGVELVHGPGCPVCVTPLEMIDKAHAIARRPEVIFCSFGDMLRVPSSDGDLFTIKSEGGNVRVVYSPLDCLKIARANPERKVVFFAIGFETAAPAIAISMIDQIVEESESRGGLDVQLVHLKLGSSPGSTRPRCCLRTSSPARNAASGVAPLD
jgi:hydrogenase expression/formation protein HypD